MKYSWRKHNDHSFGLISREILDIIYDNIDNELILGLIGSRQVGKSSIMFMLIEKLLNSGINASNIFYFNLDDMHLQRLFTSLPELIGFIGEDKEKKYLFIDEVQRLQSPGLILSATKKTTHFLNGFKKASRTRL
ncbi:MAG: AAA family ATPase, partial [Bacteroidales bacterium]|nr:AAA family ATPase [Bacteroidales bacterium]